MLARCWLSFLKANSELLAAAGASAFSGGQERSLDSDLGASQADYYDARLAHEMDRSSATEQRLEQATREYNAARVEAGLPAIR